MNQKANAAALKRFEDRFAKSYGANTLKRSSEVNPYEVIPTGSLTLDYRLTVGGYVQGRIVEIWGPDGVGKTTLSIIGMREAQRKYPDKMVAFIDMEQKFDRAWAAAHGVDLERLYLYMPESGEDVADALKDFCREGLFSMVVVDSVAAMIPEKEKEKQADEAVMAAQAKIITRMVKINAVEAGKTNTAVLLINQVRANLGYGADTTTGGGWALKHGTTMKLKLRRTADTPLKIKIAGEDRIVGHRLSIYIERNGVGPAYRNAMVTLITVATDKFGPVGFDQADEATTLGIDTGVIDQSGAWYTLPGGERYQGRDKVVEALRDDPAMRDAIRQAVLASVSSEITEEEDEESGDSEGKPRFRKGVTEE